MVHKLECAVCEQPADQVCGRCHATAYCSRDHQKRHWKTHRSHCCPFRIRQDEILGRYLEATRDLSPGQVILVDPPLVLGPKQVTIPVCLGCFSPVDGSYICTFCRWPMCGPECQETTLHVPECTLSRARPKGVEISRFLQINQMYECVTPLRCLWLKDHCPEKWASFLKMEAHEEERRRTDAWDFDQTNVVNFMREYLYIEEFTEDEVHRACGVLEVNGFEIPGPGAVAIYGTACFMEHSCIPNTFRTFDSAMNVVVRAAVPIAKGDHITTSYTDPMWGTSNRQLHLLDTKYFLCSCTRCKDPTEFGTHLSSLKCQECSDGKVVPPCASDAMMQWMCNQCGAKMTKCQVETKLKIFGERLVTLKGSPSNSELFLEETKSILSENHYYRLEVKLALAQIYGREQKGLRELKDVLLQRKVDLCAEVRLLVDAFCPGQSRLRGLLQNELQVALMEQYRRLSKKNKITSKGKQILQDAFEAAKEASEILGRESPLQDEFQLSLQARDESESIKRLLSKCRP